MGGRKQGGREGGTGEVGRQVARLGSQSVKRSLRIFAAVRLPRASTLSHPPLLPPFPTQHALFLPPTTTTLPPYTSPRVPIHSACSPSSAIWTRRSYIRSCLRRKQANSHGHLRSSLDLLSCSRPTSHSLLLRSIRPREGPLVQTLSILRYAKAAPFVYHPASGRLSLARGQAGSTTAEAEHRHSTLGI